MRSTRKRIDMLAVDSLDVVFPTTDGAVMPALSQVSFSLAAGERLGVVGESGAGKSLLAAAIINLISAPGKITGGAIKFNDQSLLTLSPAQMRPVRGRHIASIFQDPMTTLNPVMTIGAQLTECLRAHKIAEGAAAEKLAIARLREVAIPSPEQQLRAYPHELSGGMRQRIVIAAALITEPELIIADEPTTALDVTTQAEIMLLLAELCQRRRMGLMLITHDLSLLAQITDTIMVMYAGRIVERGNTAQVTQTPRHPYTRGLLAALGGRGEDGRFAQIHGNMPPLSDIPTGCAFHPRCNYARERCHHEMPALTDGVACHFSEEILTHHASPPPR